MDEEDYPFTPVNSHKLLSLAVCTASMQTALIRQPDNPYLVSLGNNFQKLIELKNDPEQCRFLSTHTGFDIQRGLENLQHGGLIIQNAPHDFIQCNPHGSALLFILNSSLHHKDPRITDMTLAHEFGHMVMLSSLYNTDPAVEEQDLTAAMPRPEHRPKTNHALEFAADKVAVTLHPEHRTSAMLNAARTGMRWRTGMNWLYDKNILPDFAARGLAAFYTMRDELFNRTVNKNKWTSWIANSACFMHSMPSHPSDLVRSVEAEKFARKLQHIKNQ